MNYSLEAAFRSLDSREFLFDVEEKIFSFFNTPKSECVFYDLNSYQRMLVHTLAKFFGLSSSSKSSKRNCEEDEENNEDESEKYKDLYLSKNNEKIKFPILKLKNYLTKLQLDSHYEQKEEELKPKEKSTEKAKKHSQTKNDNVNKKEKEDKNLKENGYEEEEKKDSNSFTSKEKKNEEELQEKVYSSSSYRNRGRKNGEKKPNNCSTSSNRGDKKEEEEMEEPTKISFLPTTKHILLLTKKEDEKIEEITILLKKFEKEFHLNNIDDSSYFIIFDSIKTAEEAKDSLLFAKKNVDSLNSLNATMRKKYLENEYIFQAGTRPELNKNVAKRLITAHLNI